MHFAAIDLQADSYRLNRVRIHDSLVEAIDADQDQVAPDYSELDMTFDLKPAKPHLLEAAI